MSGGDDFIKLAAVAVTAAIFTGAIVKPNAGREAVERATAAAASIETTSYAERPCTIGGSALTRAFAPIDDVLSVSPLGGVTAPGETLPAPYIRVNTRRVEASAFQRRMTDAFAPAKAEIVAIERKIDRDNDGRATGQSWTVHFSLCEKISFYYDRLDQLSDDVLRRSGGMKNFIELGGPDHLAMETSVKIAAGELIGRSDGFDIGLHDNGAPEARLERPERYSTNAYARADFLDATPTLINAITPNVSRAQCPLDYMTKEDQAAWSAKLGDSWGIRKARGEDTCRAAINDLPDAAQGVWYTDSAHNAAATKVSAIALSSDAIDPTRLIFALHGRLPSLTAEMVALAPFMDHERARAAKDFLSFAHGDGRINTAFADVRDNNVYCYQELRVNFVGPRINGVMLLERQSGEAGPSLLKIEARDDVRACIDLEEPWAFHGNETTFYR